MLIYIIEIADALPRKTVVDHSRGHRKQLRKKASHKRKADKAPSEPSISTSKRPRVTIEDIPDEQAGGVRVSASSSTMSVECLLRKVSNISSVPPIPINLTLQPAGKRNPIYHFYESVSTNSQGQVGNPGDRHYKCYHGNRKVITVTRAMKYSLNGNHILLL